MTPPPERESQRRTLLELTQIPTASGRESRVVRYIERWARARSDVRIDTDRAGNLVLSSRLLAMRGKPTARGPLLITAHLDHPAFVVERLIGPHTVELSFRGGVMDVYFESARIVVHSSDVAGPPIGATLIGESTDGPASPFGKLYLAELDGGEADDGARTGPTATIRPGDVAVWALPPAQIDEENILHAAACDDLAAAAAALEAFDALRRQAMRWNAHGDKGSKGNRANPPIETRLLFTRAEEIGFIGAIAACKLGTIPKGSRIVALENSRAFPESPIGAGPIVRVGDRMSVFSPKLTAACAKRAEELAGKPATPRSTDRAATGAAGSQGMKWQRKLMAGGACEATVFCAYGHEATCLCLPLGNYHNMANLDAVQNNQHDASKLGPPRIGREYISVDDYFGLIDLLVALGEGLPDVDPIVPKLEGLYAGKSAVLRDEAPKTAETRATAAQRRTSSGRGAAKAPAKTGGRPTPAKKARTAKSPVSPRAASKSAGRNKGNSKGRTAARPTKRAPRK